jgi:hypothetical protein
LALLQVVSDTLNLVKKAREEVTVEEAIELSLLQTACDTANRTKQVSKKVATK